MAPLNRTARIKTLSTALIALGGVFLIYFVWRYVTFVVPLAFGDDGMLQRWFGYEDHATHIPLSTRLVYFIMTLLPNLAAVAAVLIGIRLMFHFRAEQYFHARTISTLRHIGLALMILAATAIFATIAINPWVTQHRPEGALPFNFHIGTYDLGYLLAGILVYIVGWVMGEALKIQQENEGFV